MKADLSRDTFNPIKHFLRVIQQQGRVEIDADPNEQAAILIRYLQTLATDLIGPFGGPKGNGGFLLAWVNGTLYVNPGRYYVDGVLCELEPGPEIKNSDVVNLLKQAGLSNFAVPYYAQPDRRIDANSDPLPEAAALVYLDAWEHHVTAIEDGSIREVALGGPDTSTRSKVLSQVKVTPPPEGLSVDSCAVVRRDWAKWEEFLQPPDRGRLAARDNKAQATNDPCITPPTAGYRGAENQLYRVEIRTSGVCRQAGGAAEIQPKVATFVWSRENGSVLSAWDVSSNRIVLADPGRDAKLGFAPGDWIELTDDAHELNGQRGTLVKITAVEDNVLTIDEASADGPIDSSMFADNPKIRRWDSDGALAVEIPATNKGWIHLEDGVEIMFSATDGEYHAGDYWLIPARILGGVEWPMEGENQALLPPRGITHRYAPLGILRTQAQPPTGATAPPPEESVLESCLCTFDPLCS